jgi:hypothetical protein
MLTVLEQRAWPRCTFVTSLSGTYMEDKTKTACDLGLRSLRFGIPLFSTVVHGT